MSAPGVSLLAAPLRTLAHWLTEFALPQRCAGCAAPIAGVRVLCGPCEARIPRLATPLCARCLVRGGDGSPCARHAGRAVFAPWLNDERATAVVHALKYGDRPALARDLGAVMAAAVPSAWRRGTLVTEVPLHPARRRERGYNQAELLSSSLADEIGAPHVPGLLRRVRATPAQARLGGEERRRNLAGAFAATRPGWLAGRRILVVDDVLTTGATLDACLETLERAGAKVAGVALAWTP
ncbi:MAG: ComF family protein [Candidatus Eisenbacteria bacterium]|nr:ComF family protein [Candidatus Eisenbacteria bacterium]